MGVGGGDSGFAVEVTVESVSAGLVVIVARESARVLATVVEGVGMCSGVVFTCSCARGSFETGMSIFAVLDCCVVDVCTGVDGVTKSLEMETGVCVVDSFSTDGVVCSVVRVS